MALGGVFMNDTDGNIGYSSNNLIQKVSGLVFDISKQARFWEEGAGLAAKSKLQGKIVEINTLADLEALGITPYSGSTEKDLLFGIPYYHIKHFFEVQRSNSERLFVAFADCSENWDIISEMQHVAHGIIYQIGVWTDQSLWNSNDAEADSYALQLVHDLELKAEELAQDNSPVSILLSANTAVLDNLEKPGKAVDLQKIPTCIGTERCVSVLLSQDVDVNGNVAAMQKANKNSTPVGIVGAVLGCLSMASVQESIAWVQKFNLFGVFRDIEMGFGDVEDWKSTLKYASLNSRQLDALDGKGYIFLCRYAGIENGIYISHDQTCSQGDYRTIARNRTINKSRRGVREALLPFVNSPLLVDPASGLLSAGKIASFQQLVSDVLTNMQTNGEISGYGVSIDPNQNVLKNDTLKIKYVLVPVGVASRIEVTEGLALSNNIGGSAAPKQ